MRTLDGRPFLILLIEDNDDHAELMMRSLQEHRVINEVIHIKDGMEAMDFLFHRGIHAADILSVPDLILLDLRLPRVDGLTILKAIKEDDTLKKIPVVIMTSSNAEKDVQTAYQYHANSYITKPIEFLDFTRMMEDLGYYWIGWNMNPFQ